MKNTFYVAEPLHDARHIAEVSIPLRGIGYEKRVAINLGGSEWSSETRFHPLAGNWL